MVRTTGERDDFKNDAMMVKGMHYVESINTQEKKQYISPGTRIRLSANEFHYVRLFLRNDIFNVSIQPVSTLLTSEITPRFTMTQDAFVVRIDGRP